MAVLLSSPSPLFLREAELRRGIELLYFGYRDLTSEPDAVLDQHGFGRAHHRALYFIARQPSLIISDLLTLLKITKQSLARVLADLQARGLVETSVGRSDRRQRHLKLTPQGEALERELFDALRVRMQRAYEKAGPQAVAGFWQVLTELQDDGQRADIEKLLNYSGS
jgi:DNA-binding MarR family transcriptional regulator